MQALSYWPLAWMATLIVLAIAARRTLVDRPRWLMVGSVALRSLAVALLAFALCRPFLSHETRRLHVALLVDASQSVDLATARSAVNQVDVALGELEATDSWSLFLLGDGVRQCATTTALRAVLDEWEQGAADESFRSATRLADALLGVRFSLPAGKAHRVVVLSDGRPTDDGLERSLALLREESVDVRFAPLAGRTEAEAAVVGLVPATPTAFENEVVRFTARLAANAPLTATVRLVHRGVVVAQRDAQITPDGDNRVTFDAPMYTAGPTVWTAEITPQNDCFAVNNRASCIVNVRGEPRVLFVHQKPRRLRSLARALEKQGFSVDLRGARGLPEQQSELLAFDAIVLADVAATDITTRQMVMLQRYVSEFGGGLMMMGSENSFGLGGYYKTPVEQVLPLVSRFEKEKEKPSLAMVLVIDKSGSMQGVPIALARQAAKAAVELLSPRDQIGVAAFDGEARVICEMTYASDSASVQNAIDGLGAGGGTFMYAGMHVGREMLEAAHAKMKHMIVLSDGCTQPADHDGLVAELVDMNVTVSTVALGAGADQQLMARLAEAGHGRYYQTLDPTSVPQIFTRETMQASRSAIKEDLFPVVQVGDHPMLTDYEHAQLPFALGYVMTQAKPTAQVVLAADTGDPLLAVMRFGLGVGAAYTSDLTDRWGGEWLAWEGCGRFWAQVLRSIVRKADHPGFSAYGDTTGEVWRVRVSRQDSAETPLDNIQWDAQVADEFENMTPVKVRQTGLGRYEAVVPLAGREELTLCLHDVDHDAVKTLHYRRPYPREYQLQQRVAPEMAAAATFEPQRVRADTPPTQRRSSAVPGAVWAALACLIAGLLLRRV